MEKILIGKIGNTFGLKGELKVVSRFEHGDKAFKLGNQIYLNEEIHTITKTRYHHYNYLVEIDNLKDINLVEKYIGSNVYITKKELSLNDNEYLYDELINMEVYNADKLVGKVEGLNITRNNPLIKVNGFYIPLRSNFIIKVDKNERKIYCQNIDSLML